MSDRATGLLHRARQRDVYGLGGSNRIARDVSHKFARTGLRSSVFDDAHMLMSTAPLPPDDVVPAFSHSVTTSAVTEAVERVRASGAPPHRRPQQCRLASGPYEAGRAGQKKGMK